MVDVARVSMFGMPVGIFRWDERYQVAQFEYDHRFLGRGIEPSPLMMPVREGRVYSFASLNRETFMGLPGMLADSLPDTYGRALFDRWLALTGHTTSNPIESLCLVVRNQDDHTKNISFLMDEDGKWRLSPAYDMGYAYNPNGGWTAMHQMSIGGKFDNISRKDLISFAKVNNIKNAQEIIDEVHEVASKWPDFAKECGVPSAIIDNILPNFILT